MNLIKLQRTPFEGWPGFSRLPDLHEELVRLFNGPSPATEEAASVSAWVPAVDVTEAKDTYSVTLELPGVSKEDVNLSLEKGCLTISGERKREATPAGGKALHCERYYGRFQRSITLPAAVAADLAKAQYKDGVLTVTLPKSEDAKPKHIDIALN